MPYEMKCDGPDDCMVMNKDTGKVHGKHMTKKNAMRQMRLLRGVEKGEFKPTGAKAKK